MKFTSLRNETVIISRMTALSSGKNYYATVTASEVVLQPMKFEKAQLSDGVFGKTYVIFAETTVDIKAGDRIRDSLSNHYKVKADGVTLHDMGGCQYYQVIIERI